MAVNQKQEGVEYIFVQATSTDGRAGLWERNDLHPAEEGEVFVAGDDIVEVAETALVRQKLKNKELKRVEGPARKTGAAPETDSNRSILGVVNTPVELRDPQTTETSESPEGKAELESAKPSESTAIKADEPVVAPAKNTKK